MIPFWDCLNNTSCTVLNHWVLCSICIIFPWNRYKDWITNSLWNWTETPKINCIQGGLHLKFGYSPVLMLQLLDIQFYLHIAIYICMYKPLDNPVTVCFNNSVNLLSRDTGFSDGESMVENIMFERYRMLKFFSKNVY